MLLIGLLYITEIEISGQCFLILKINMVSCGILNEFHFCFNETAVLYL